MGGEFAVPMVGGGGKHGGGVRCPHGGGWGEHGGSLPEKCPTRGKSI